MSNVRRQIILDQVAYCPMELLGLNEALQTQLTNPGNNHSIHIVKW
jgi:hypothetical protein